MSYSSADRGEERCWLGPLGSRCPGRVRGHLRGMPVKEKGEREQRKAERVFKLWGGSDTCERRGEGWAPG